MTDNGIHVDGGLLNYTLFENLPRGKGYAKVNLSPDKREVVELDAIDNTNNEAELFAITFGITQAVKNSASIIYSDSEWAIKASTRKYKVKEPRLALIACTNHALLSFYHIELRWISREDNWAT